MFSSVVSFTIDYFLTLQFRAGSRRLGPIMWKSELVRTPSVGGVQWVQREMRTHALAHRTTHTRYHSLTTPTLTFKHTHIRTLCRLHRNIQKRRGAKTQRDLQAYNQIDTRTEKKDVFRFTQLDICQEKKDRQIVRPISLNDKH